VSKVQLTLEWPRRTALGRTDFLVSDSNAAAVERIERWPDWPHGALVLHGAAGCGKTHLANVWRERAAAVMIEGASLDQEQVARLIAEGRYRIAIDAADHARERALLHLYNACLECRGSMLLTARRPPASWTTTLADLGSRLRATPAIEIARPDDALLAAILVKQFGDRQLRVAPEVITYLTRHMERSFAAAVDIVTQLDAVSLREARAISVPLASKLLGELSQDESGVR
jgi:chromosomal replication initiation ATPase DnaA